MMDIIKGIVAIRVGRYWLGAIEGNRYCGQNRRTAKEALKDAKKLLAKTNAGLKRK